MAKNNLSRDVRGNYQRECGFKISEDGKIRPQRFYLGRDRALAMLANVHLEQCWASVARRWQMYRLTERPVWESCTLKIAMAVARGEPEVTLTVLEVSTVRAGRGPGGGGHMGLGRVLRRKSTAPGHGPGGAVAATFRGRVGLVPGTATRFSLGPVGPEERTGPASMWSYAKSITPLVENANPGPTGSDTLHKALRAFREWLGSVKYARDGKPKPFGLIAQ